MRVDFDTARGSSFNRRNASECEILVVWHRTCLTHEPLSLYPRHLALRQFNDHTKWPPLVTGVEASGSRLLGTAALTATLLFTLPTTGRAVWTSNDSSYATCSGGPTITTLQKAQLYFYPVSGGGYRLLQEKSVIGRAGQPDSFVFDPGVGGHFYVATTNSSGTSCASNPVYVRGSIVTGLPTEETPLPRDMIAWTRIYDVQGRRVQSPLRALRSGIYWRVDRYASGLVRKKRLVIVK